MSKTVIKKDLKGMHIKCKIFFAHYGQGYRAEHYHLSRSKTIYNIVAIVNPLNSTYVKSVLWHEIKNLPLGHLVDSINVLGNALPDSAIDYAEAYKQAEERTNMWYTQWKKCCCKKGDAWVRHIDSSGKSACTNFTQPSNPYGETAAPPTFGRRKRFLQELAPNISYPDIKPNQINTRVLKAYKNA